MLHLLNHFVSQLFSCMLRVVRKKDHFRLEDFSWESVGDKKSNSIFLLLRPSGDAWFQWVWAAVTSLSNAPFSVAGFLLGHLHRYWCWFFPSFNFAANSSANFPFFMAESRSSAFPETLVSPSSNWFLFFCKLNFGSICKIGLKIVFQMSAAL